MVFPLLAGSMHYLEGQGVFQTDTNGRLGLLPQKWVDGVGILLKAASLADMLTKPAFEIGEAGTVTIYPLQI